MAEFFKKLFSKVKGEGMVIHAKVSVEFDSKKDAGHFSLKKNKEIYFVPFTTHVSDIRNFYRVPEEQWEEPEHEEVRVDTRTGKGYIMQYPYNSLIEKFILYYRL